MGTVTSTGWLLSARVALLKDLEQQAMERNLVEKLRVQRMGKLVLVRWST
jgi:hypothetical protein